jgi:hypothetical protein
VTEWTHKLLVERAGRWLTNTRKCVLVLQEPSCWAVREYPDAIGWSLEGESVLVECKMSVPDFRRDRFKESKLAAQEQGKETMGMERWFMTPPGLVKAEMVPEGCGLLEVRGRVVKRIVEAHAVERPGREAAELPLLINIVRRAAWKEAGLKERMVRVQCANQEEP